MIGWAAFCAVCGAGIFAGAAATTGGWPTAPAVYRLTGVLLGVALCILVVSVLT